MNKEELIRQKEAEITADLERWATEAGLRTSGETIRCSIRIQPAPRTTIIAVKRRRREYERLEEPVTEEELQQLAAHFQRGEPQTIMGQLLRSSNKPVLPKCSFGSVVSGMNTKLTNLGLMYRIYSQGQHGANFHRKPLKFYKVRVRE